MQGPLRKHGRRRIMGLTTNDKLSGLLGRRSICTVDRAAPPLPLPSSPPPPWQLQKAILPDWRHQHHPLHLQPCQPWLQQRRCFGKLSRTLAIGHPHLPYAMHSSTSNHLSRQDLRRPALAACHGRPHLLNAAVGVHADRSSTSLLSAARVRLQHAFQAAIRAAKPRLAIGAACTVGRLKLLV